MKKEYKLRPSMSWAEMALAVQAMDKYISDSVASKQVSKQVMEMARVKEYLETFKPQETSALSEQETLVKLMAKYGVVANSPQVLSVTTVSEQVWNKPIELEESKDFSVSSRIEPLSDDDRYDILKLSGESSYSDDDKLFMLNKGTMIMMQRAGMKKVNVGDL